MHISAKNKNNKNGGSGQVRSPERDCRPHLRKVCNHVRARGFHGAISSLRVFITVPVCVICISQTLYICDLRSGQSRDLYITSLWENNEMCRAVNDSKPQSSFRITSDYVICNDPGGIY